MRRAEEYVLILFGTNEVSYSAAAALEGSGFKSLGYFPKSSINFLKFSDKFHRKGCSAFRWDSVGYRQELVSFLKKFESREKILTFLANDEAVSFWIKQQTVLSEYLTVLTEDIERFYNKILLYALLERISVACPRTWPLSEISEEKLPFLIKPASRDFSREANDHELAKVQIVRNGADLKKIKKAHPQQWICQEVLDFYSGDEYGWWGYRSPRGEIVSTVARHKRKYPNKNGRITHLEIVVHPTVKGMGDTIVKQLDYRGLAEIQFLFDRKTNIFKVIDFNPRLWCGHSALLLNNMNLIRKCAEDYYRVQPAEPSAKSFYDVESFVPREWFSILDNIHQFNVFKIRCSEFYGWVSDNLKTKAFLVFFLLAKVIYYFFTQGLIRRY